jgi:hypothetical protein
MQPPGAHPNEVRVGDFRRPEGVHLFRNPRLTRITYSNPSLRFFTTNSSTVSFPILSSSIRPVPIPRLLIPSAPMDRFHKNVGLEELLTQLFR